MIWFCNFIELLVLNILIYNCSLFAHGYIIPSHTKHTVHKNSSNRRLRKQSAAFPKKEKNEAVFGVLLAANVWWPEAFHWLKVAPAQLPIPTRWPTSLRLRLSCEFWSLESVRFCRSCVLDVLCQRCPRRMSDIALSTLGVGRFIGFWRKLAKKAG